MATEFQSKKAAVFTWFESYCLKNSDRKRRVNCLLPWILKTLNLLRKNFHDELQSRGISRPRKNIEKKWLMESLEPYDGRSAVWAFWRRFRKAAPCSSKIREQTQMFDQYVVKNRHSLKLRYLGPIRCSTRFCRPTAIMGSRAIGRSEV